MDLDIVADSEGEAEGLGVGMAMGGPSTIYSPPSARAVLPRRSIVQSDLDSSDGNEDAIVASSLTPKFPGKGNRMGDIVIGGVGSGSVTPMEVEEVVLGVAGLGEEDTTMLEDIAGNVGPSTAITLSSPAPKHDVLVPLSCV